jgi:hypothetical protein
VTRLPYFLPGKKKVVVDSSIPIDKAKLKKKLNEHKYMQFFARNKFEYDIYEELADFWGDTYRSKLEFVKSLNKKLGYVI